MFYRIATPYGLWLQIVMTLGGIVSLTTVGMTVMLSQTRIFYAMAHDGLLPQIFARVHRRWITPWIATLISGDYFLSRMFSILDFWMYRYFLCSFLWFLSR